MILPFDLPPPAGYSISPIWDGSHFVLGNEKFQVLEYSENFSGWSDDLTTLHEEAAGDSHPIDLASRLDALNQVKKSIPSKNPVILEIGCSSGYLIRSLVQQFPDAIVIGADVVKDPLYRLAQSLPCVPMLRFDLLQNPLPKQCIDVLVMLNVLEHIEDDVAALHNVYSLLKPGGSLIIEVPAGPYLYDLYDSELCHFRRYSAQELIEKIQSVGLTVKRQSHLGFLLFPAFATIKLLNKWKYLNKNNSRSDNLVVSKLAAKSSRNRLLNLAMKIESALKLRFNFPFGIRVLITAEKNKGNG